MKFPKYPEYKDSGVEWLGKVPAHWNLSRSDAYINTSAETVPVDKLKDKDVFHYSIPVVQSTGEGQYEDGSEIESSKLLISGKQVLVSKLNPRKGTVCLAFPHEELTVCSGEFVPLKPKKLYLKFLLYLVMSTNFRFRLESKVVSVTRSHQRASPTDIAKFRWAFPHKSEQVKIAAFLDHETARIDALIDEQQRLIELLKEKRQAVISHAVTKGLNPDVPMKDSGVEWLGEVPAHWGVERFKLSVESCRNGIWGEEPAGDGNDLPCVRVADFDRTRLRVVLEEPTLRNIKPNEKKGRLLTRGNLVLEKSGGGEKQPVGFVVLYDDERDAVCSNFTAKIELSDGMNPSYWRYVHAAAYLIRLNVPSIKQTSGIQNLDQQSYLDERAAYPPKDEQAKIAAYLDHETARIDALVKEGESVINLLKERRSALISAAVTGKIDVRDWKASADAAPEPYDMAAESGALYEVNRS